MSLIKLERQNFGVLCLTLFMISYNVAVLPPIMPLLVRQLNTSIGYVQGALVLFSLVTAAFAPTCENLCRFYGRTRVFGVGLALYGVGIAITALSPDIGVLVVSFSLFTGLAATPLVSTPWTIVDFAYDGKQEQQAILSLTLASTLGGLAGSILGGLIATNLGWRWAFLPALVVFVLVAVLGRSLPETVAPLQTPIDWVGGLVSFLGLGSILLGISLAGEFGWWQPKRLFSIAGVIIPPFALSIVPTLISVGVVCLGFFVFWQRQQAHQAGASLLRVGLLRKPVFVFGLLTTLLHDLIATGIQFNLYQFLPAVLLLNPGQTALAVLPYNLTMVVVIVVLLKYLDLDRQFPPKYIVYFGLALITVGIGGLYWAIGPDLTPLHLLPPLIVMGIGSGCFSAYIGSLTYSVASRAEKPEGTGIYRPAQQLGSSLGRGILGTILIAFTSTQIVDRVLQTLGKTLSPEQRQEAIAFLQRIIQTYSRSERREILSQMLPEAVKAQFPSILEASAIAGIRTALLVALGLSLVCLGLATTLPKSPGRPNSPEEISEEPPEQP
ncbi:MAG: MFS transporter [Elainella sp.]